MKPMRAQLAAVRDTLFPRRMCAKKRRYATRMLATFVLRDRQPKEQAKLQVYECPECHGWHLTRLEQHP